MKKLICFFGIIFAMMIAFSINAFAAVNITTKQALPAGSINTPYNAPINVEGGSGDYTFSFVNTKNIPEGLSISASSGIISGTPTVGGYAYPDIEVMVTDNVTGETAIKKFSIKIQAKTVQFTVTHADYTYDGQPHTAKVVPFISGKDASDIITNYTVTYANQLSQTRVGSYSIKVVVNTPGYKTGTLSRKYLNIAKNDNVELDFGNLTFDYNGRPQHPNPTVVGHPTDGVSENIAYTLYYEGVNGTNYAYSLNPPTMPGNYRVTCFINDSNYRLPTENSAVFEILPTTVTFNLQSPYRITYGDTWTADFATMPNVDASEYTVSYVKDGVEYSTPGDVGVYNIKIAFKRGSHYAVGFVNPAIVIVEQKEVNFTVSPGTITETGDVIDVSVTTDDPLVEGEDYDVTFIKEGVESEVKEAGVYDVSIDEYNPNYVLGAIRPSKVVVKELESVEKSPLFFYQTNDAVYSGSEQEIELISTADLEKDVDYTVTYSQSGAAVTPKDAGTYDISVELIGDAAEEYEIEEVPETFTIKQKPVYFILKNISFQYNNTVQAPEITNDCDMTAYSVGYSSGGFVVDEPKDAGTYRVSITVEDSNYIYNGQNTNQFVIEANPHNVNLNYDADIGAISFESGGAVTQTGDPVQLVITPHDGYFIEDITTEGITLDEDYAFIMPDEDVTIHVTFRRIAAIKLNLGNSIFARIEKNSAISEKDRAKEQFLADRLYDGKYYSAAAWGADDIDADDSALILYNRVNTALPSAVGYTSHDEEAELSVTLAVGDRVIDLTDKTDIKVDDILPGVYSMQYRFFDEYLQKDITAERKVVILWNLGDVNLDRNTNGADANWLTQYYPSLGEESDYEKLFKFRMCDVDKDGIVGESDIRAILERVSKRIQQYYR